MRHSNGTISENNAQMKTMRFADNSLHECRTLTRRDLAFAVILAIFAFASTWYYITKIPGGQPPDEWAHVSYVLDVSSRGHLIPDYKNSHILSSSQKNYLTHPPLYYSTLGMIGRITGWNPVGDYRAFRAVSAAMVALGILFWSLTAIGFGSTRVITTILIVATLAIPMFPYLAGSINNDNLAYLGAAVFFLGLHFLYGRRVSGYYICAVGLIAAFLTKATVSLFLVAFIGIWIYLSRSEAKRIFGNNHFVYAALSVIVLCGAYYIPIIAIYRTPFPAPAGLYAHAPPANPIGLFDFVMVFFRTMVQRLPVVLTSSKGFLPIPGKAIWLFYAMLCLPTIVWAVCRPFLVQSRVRNVTDAMFLALAITVGVHIIVCYRGYLSTGLFAGMQPRYYNYMLPAIFLFPLLNVGERRLRLATIGAFAAIAVFLIGVEPALAAAGHIAYRSERAHDAITVPHGVAGSELKIGVAQTQAGYVDVVRRSGHHWSLAGWAVDAATKRPADSVLIVFNQELVGAIKPHGPRRDVARALGSTDALHSGYRVDVSGLPESIDPCDFEVFAAQAHGGFAVLKNSACAH